MKKSLSLFSIPLLLTVMPLAADVSTTDHYSPGGWPTLHLDSGNRRNAPVSVTSRTYNAWHALAGATVLVAPTTSPTADQLYVTTGLAAGNSNLYAFSIDGQLLWQSEPWRDADTGIDPCAVLSSPIVDVAGDIYVNDCNQMFAFNADGRRKWVSTLPDTHEDDWRAAGSHPVNAFTTAAFTANGHVLGVTNFGDVVILDRETGATLNMPYRLPGKIAPYAEVIPMPDSLFGDGLLDPGFREWSWQLIFGGSMRSANTPAVSRENRVFVVGTSTREGMGALYGLDLEATEHGIEIRQVFATDIGIGSGSSPALSPAEDQVYVSDEEGYLYGLSTGTGDIIWRLKTRAAAGAAAVGSDGTVYALQVNAPAVIAVSPAGEVLWESDISELDNGLPRSMLFGEPVGKGNGNPTVTADAVLVPVTYGYEIPFGGQFTLPVRSTVVALDLASGKAIAHIVDLPDDSAGITAVLPDGTIVSTHGAVLTSILAPLKPLADWLLPSDVEQMAALGGFQVARP
jgi:outer membrane protein assembly factor BamB